MKIFTAEGNTLFEAYFDENSGIAGMAPEDGLFVLVPNPAQGVVEVRTGENATCEGGCRMVMHDMSGCEVKRTA